MIDLPRHSGVCFRRKLRGILRRRFILGGSWVVISKFISLRKWIIVIFTLLITPLANAHEPPSTGAIGHK